MHAREVVDVQVRQENDSSPQVGFLEAGQEVDRRSEAGYGARGEVNRAGLKPATSWVRSLSSEERGGSNRMVERLPALRRRALPLPSHALRGDLLDVVPRVGPSAGPTTPLSF
jgi:hypothetical protein